MHEKVYRFCLLKKRDLADECLSGLHDKCLLRCDFLESDRYYFRIAEYPEILIGCTDTS